MNIRSQKTPFYPLFCHYSNVQSNENRYPVFSKLIPQSEHNKSSFLPKPNIIQISKQYHLPRHIIHASFYCQQVKYLCVPTFFEMVSVLFLATENREEFFPACYFFALFYVIFSNSFKFRVIA